MHSPRDLIPPNVRTIANDLYMRIFESFLSLMYDIWCLVARMNRLRFSSSCPAQRCAANEWCLLWPMRGLGLVRVNQWEASFELNQLDLTTSAKIVLLLATGNSMPKETLEMIERLLLANQRKVSGKMDQWEESWYRDPLYREQKRTLLHVCWFMCMEDIWQYMAAQFKTIYFNVCKNPNTYHSPVQLYITYLQAVQYFEFQTFILEV